MGAGCPRKPVTPLPMEELTPHSREVFPPLNMGMGELDPMTCTKESLLA